MLVSARADYPVRVRPQSWDEAAEVAPLYAGAYEVTLNNVVDVAFVPDLSDVGPPFPTDLVPYNIDLITTTTQARLVLMTFAAYAVTPNDSLAGRTQRLPPDGAGTGGGLVFFVGEAQFATFTDELEELSSRLGALHPEGVVSDLTGYGVIQFLRETVVRAPGFAPADRAMLEDPVPGPE